MVTVEGSESLVMRNDTSNVDEAGEMKRTLSFSPEGITEVVFPVNSFIRKEHNRCFEGNCLPIYF